MKTIRLHRILAIVNLLILLIFVSDTYFIQPVRIKEVFHMYNSVYSHNKYGAGSWTNYIETESGKSYWQPDGTPARLELGDTFFIEKSRMFSKPLHLIYPRSSSDMIIDCGGLNEGWFMKVLSVYIFIVSLITLAGWSVFKNPNYNERLIFSGSTLMAVLIFVYFYT